MLATPQLSVKLAVPVTIGVVCSVHLMVNSGGQIILGGSLSVTVTINKQGEVAFPDLSMETHDMLVMPTLKFVGVLLINIPKVAPVIVQLITGWLSQLSTMLIVGVYDPKHFPGFEFIV